MRIPVLTLGFLAAVLLAYVPGNLSRATAPAAAAEKALTPVADAYVTSAEATSNFGSRTALRTDNSPEVRSYLRFDVQGISGPVTRATLRIYATSASKAGYQVRAVSNNSWTERGITFSNAPAMSGTVTGSSGAVNAGAWTTVDVTPLITGTGQRSLAITTTSSTALALASREAGANAPQLIVETGSAGATPTRTASPTQTTATPTSSPVTATPTPPPGSQPSGPIRAGFFYPWFANAWTQGGVFPYTNYTPSLGYYDSRDNATIDEQLRLADRAHLQAFIASWWGPGHHTDAALQHILPRSSRPDSPNRDLRWAVYHEEESLGDPSVDKLVADMQHLSRTLFAQPSYLRIDNRPVVFVYADPNDGASMAGRWAQAKARLGGNLYVVLKVYQGYNSDPNQPDSWHQYAPAVAYDAQLPYSVTVSPGFWKEGESPRLARDPARFEADVKRMAASGAAWQLVTAWNEWGEGTSVEPANEFGNTYIDILCRNLPGSATCGGGTPAPTPTRPTSPTPAPTSSPGATPTPAPGSGSAPVLVAAGDIASCSSSGDEATAQLLDGVFAGGRAGLVAALGDNVYEEGTSSQFANCYEPSWGRHKSRTKPIPGNHEYLTSGASGYYNYFGAAAGDPSKGYYSYNLGSWHIVALNSNCSKIGGCGAGSPQERWLRADLAANPTSCTLAYWHHPRFSSGQHGSTSQMQAMWQALYDHGVEAVLSGHDHHYERFAPQTATGTLDRTRGVREFLVGSGGKNHYPISGAPIANSEVRNDDTFGVLQLTLREGGYDWKFLPVAGKTFTDSGSESCR